MFLEDDVVEMLFKRAEQAGALPSDYLRCLLNHPPKRSTRKPKEGPSGRRSAIGKFLAILCELHARYPADFSRLANVRGAHRCYFSRDCAEIERSGKNTKPKAIGETGWWVVSNISDERKTRILNEALGQIGCPRSESEQWLQEFAEAIARPESITTPELPVPDDDDPSKI